MKSTFYVKKNCAVFIKNFNGFTLIELLIVVAIIGILSSVVLVSLNSARSKGKDARIIATVQQLRTQIESESNGSDYGNSFTAGAANVVYIGKGATAYSQLLTDASANAPTGFSASSTLSGTNSVTGQALASSEIVVVVNGTASGANAWGTGNANIPTAYAIWGRLSTSNYFCIDSTGNTKNGTTVTLATVAADVTCH